MVFFVRITVNQSHLRPICKSTKFNPKIQRTIYLINFQQLRLHVPDFIRTVVKRFKNDKEFIATLMRIVKLLAEGNQIPEEYNPHPLKGNWKNFMECHVENDTLLIWFDKENDTIELVRLGSHSELFGKGRKR